METDLSRILESRQALTDAHVKYFVYQILRGMKYLVSATCQRSDPTHLPDPTQFEAPAACCDWALRRGRTRVLLLGCWR
jgi:hypothetical protein